MNFNETFKKYQNGTATKEEKKYVESEISKHKELTEYLYENASEELDFQSDSAIMESEKAFTEAVKKKTRKKFFAMGSIIFALLLVVVLFVQFGLSPLVSAFYYNPKEALMYEGSDEDGETWGEEFPRIELDMAVYTELTRPLEKRTPQTIIDRGYGKYSVSFTQGSWTNVIPRAPSVSGEIERNKLIMYDPAFLQPYASNLFTIYDIESDRDDIDEFIKDKRDFSYAALEEMKPDKYYKVFISLKDYYRFEQVVKSFDKYNYWDLWLAVRISNQLSNHVDETCGLFGMSNAEVPFIYSGVYDEKKYPNLLNHYDDIANPDASEYSVDEFMEKFNDATYMKTHMLSLLKYMTDHKDFAKLMDSAVYDDLVGNTPSAADSYNKAYRYLKKHPLEVYGIIAYLDKEMVKKVLENDMVSDVQLALDE